MATNRTFAPTNNLTVPDSTLTGPNTPFESGDPVLFGVGNAPAVCLGDEVDSEVTVQFGAATVVYRLATEGQDATVGAAIAAGDIVYYDAGVINADATNGTAYGTALEAVGSGATATIAVAVGLGV